MDDEQAAEIVAYENGLRDRIAELQRREALLTAFVAVARELVNFGGVTEDTPLDTLDLWIEIAGRYAIANAALDRLDMP